MPTTTPPDTPAPMSPGSTDDPPRNPLEPTWAEHWDRTRGRHCGWWRGEDLVLKVHAPLDVPRCDLPEPPRPRDAEDRWIGLPGRVHRQEYALSRGLLGGEAPPVSRTMAIGAGDLAALLGCRWQFSDATVWFEPCIDDPDNHPPLRLDRGSRAFRCLTELTLADMRHAAGRYLTGLPDLVENIDILAALRDSQTLMMDLVDRPDWVERRVAQINAAYFEAYDHFYDLVKAEDGSCVFTAFGLWAPGKVAKVQCDAAAMLSPQMFRRFVVPALTEQCDWLDYAMFHLDGTQAMGHLDALLSIEPLQAIEWTPQSGIENGGDPRWYDLYRRIKAAGKSVQAVGVHAAQVIPLLDAVGPEGMYIHCHASNEAEARGLLERARPYYATATSD